MPTLERAGGPRVPARLEKTADLVSTRPRSPWTISMRCARALGYGPINIYGTLYGSRVAQVYMRRHPEEDARRGDEGDRAGVDGGA